jgi:predicted secreted hydrolase
MHRRDWLVSTAACASALRGHAAAPAAPAVAALRWPMDFGAHPDSRTEWWYVTGALEVGARLWGFQVTFFRSATGLAAGHPSAFAATELVFAHAAVTDLEQRRLRHDQRVARAGFGVAEATVGDTHVVLRDWRLGRAAATPNTPERSRYRTRVSSDSAGFDFELQFDATQPVLLQGPNGLSQKGPLPAQTSRYYSEPQLAVQGTLRLDGRALTVHGTAWLDHEWSDTLLDPQAVGWDWIGMNLADGSALMAFRIRRADGSSVYAGGSFRAPGQAPRYFGADEVRFAPGRVWESAASKARYPVQWRVQTPAGTFSVKALLDNQELDSRGSTGAVYWEGLSELLDDAGQRVGRGYLEMTGYAAKLQL